KMPTFWLTRLDRGWWRYASVVDLINVAVGNFLASIAFSLTTIYLVVGSTFPRSVYFIDFVLCFLVCAGARFAVRIYNDTLASDTTRVSKGVLIYGAGDAGMTM